MATGTVKVEVLESVGGVDYVLNGTALDTGVAEGVSLISYSPPAGVTRAKFRVTEENAGAIPLLSLTAGIK